LIQLLYAEAALVQLNVRLLSEGHAMRLQRKSFEALHSRLSKYWDEYVTGTCSAHRLLRACSDFCKNMYAYCCVLLSLFLMFVTFEVPLKFLFLFVLL